MKEADSAKQDKNIYKVWVGSCDKSGFEVLSNTTGTIKYDAINLEKGALAAKMVSKVPALSDKNPNYSFAESTHGVYTDKECTYKVCELTSRPDGSIDAVSLKRGHYFVKELKRSKGYVADKTIYEVSIEKDKTAELSLIKTPQYYRTKDIIEYMDSGLKTNKAQGSATLEHNEIQLDFFTDTKGAENKEAKADRSYMLITDTNGHVSLDAAHLKDTNDSKLLFPSLDGAAALPLGSIKISHKQSSKGYSSQNFESTHTLSEKPESTGGNDIPKNTIALSVISGDIRVVSNKHDLNELGIPQEAKMDDVNYTLRSKNTQDVVVEGRTHKKDEACLVVHPHVVGASDAKDGLAAQTTGRTLPIGSYTLELSYAKDEKARVLYAQDFTITGSNALVAVNPNAGTQRKPEQFKGAQICARILDKEGNENPLGAASLAGAEFEIKNAGEDAITIGGKSYKKGELITTIKTNAEGRAQTPKHLIPKGTYTLSLRSVGTGYKMSDALKKWNYSVVVNQDDISYELPEHAIPRCEVIRGDFRARLLDLEGKGVLSKKTFVLQDEKTHESHVVMSSEAGIIDTSSNIVAHSESTNTLDYLLNQAQLSLIHI